MAAQVMIASDILARKARDARNAGAGIFDEYLLTARESNRRIVVDYVGI